MPLEIDKFKYIILCFGYTGRGAVIFLLKAKQHKYIVGLVFVSASASGKAPLVFLRNSEFRAYNHTRIRCGQMNHICGNGTFGDQECLCVCFFKYKFVIIKLI